MARTPGRPVEIDLDSWPTLVRFAAVARVDRSGVSREKLAEHMGKRSGNLHSALFGRAGASDTITRSFLQDLERALRRIGEDRGDAAPSWRRWPLTTLTGLREELSEEREPDPGVRVHGAWFTDLCAAGPARNPVEVLVRGEALHDQLLHRRPSSTNRRRALDQHETQAVIDLLSVAGLPPSTGMAAIRVLARIGAAALPEIEKEIYQSPVGFRSLRPLSRMLWRIGLRGSGRSQTTPWPDEDASLLGELERVLSRIERQEPADPCLGRGFFVEALRWSPPQWEWVADTLNDLARRTDRPIRERMFALGVAADRLPPETAERLLVDVRSEVAATDELGLSWALDVLEQRRTGATAGRWPDRDEPRVVDDVLSAIRGLPRDELPPSVVDGAASLMQEALLSFDETRRRRACDVLNVAHLSDAVSAPLAEVFRHRGRAPRWLREHSAYVLGYLDGHDALDPLRAIVADPSDDPTVLHAAAWGLGDSCGVGASHLHRGCLPVDALTRLLLETAHDAPRQAAAYALAIVRPRGVRPALAHVVNVMDTDRTTRALARWGQWLHESDGTLSRPDDEIGIVGSRTLVFGRQSPR